MLVLLMVLTLLLNAVNYSIALMIIASDSNALRTKTQLNK